MKIARTLLIGTALAIVANAAVAATLKPTAQVASDSIHLSDLFAGADVDAAALVGPAPAPGSQAVYDALSLTRLAQAYKLDWKATAADQRVVVTRASNDLTAGDIAAGLQRALVEAGAPAGIEVVLDNRALVVHMPTDAADAPRYENVRYDAGRNRGTADLVTPGVGGTVQRTLVGARLEDMVEVPVLTRPLRPGDAIADADVAWRRFARDRLPAGAVTDVATLAGQSARRSLPAQQPLRSADIRTPIVVAKGDVVTILLKTPFMSLSAQGRALVDGGLGEPVRVVNTSSNRTIEAQVAGPNLVTVTGPLPADHPIQRRTASN